MKRIRALVGDSVWEDATVSIDGGWLYIEFDAADLDNIAIRLDPARDSEEVMAALTGPKREAR